MPRYYEDRVPVAEVRGGLVHLSFGEQQPMVVTPVHVARCFCEATLRTLNAWDEEQAGRVVRFSTQGHG